MSLCPPLYVASAAGRRRGARALPPSPLLPAAAAAATQPTSSTSAAAGTGSEQARGERERGDESVTGAARVRTAERGEEQMMIVFFQAEEKAVGRMDGWNVGWVDGRPCLEVGKPEVKRSLLNWAQSPMSLWRRGNWRIMPYSYSYSALQSPRSSSSFRQVSCTCCAARAEDY